MGRKMKGKIGAKSLKTSLINHQHNENLIKKRQQQIAHKQNPQTPKNVKKNKQLQKENQEKFIPFNPTENLLLIGEGDFSFARSIIEQCYILPENLIVTSYDASIQELKLKYPKTFEENYKYLTDEKVSMFFRIDATNLIKSFKISRKQTWKKIMVSIGNVNLSTNVLQNVMFNFPHTGKGVKDMDRNIRDHQELVSKYFKSSKEFFKLINADIMRSRSSYTQGYSLNSNANNKIDSNGTTEEGYGKIILSVFTGEPYDLWQVRVLAKDNGLQVERSSKFQWGDYPEYHHKRTNSEQDTTKPAEERDARLYVFKKFEKRANKRSKKSQIDGPGYENDSD